MPEEKNENGFDWKWFLAWAVPLASALFISTFLPGLKFYVDNELAHVMEMFESKMVSNKDAVEKDIEIAKASNTRKLNREIKELEARMNQLLENAEQRVSALLSMNASNQFTEDEADSLRDLVNTQIGSVEKDLTRLELALDRVRDSVSKTNSNRIPVIEFQLGAIDEKIKELEGK